MLEVLKALEKLDSLIKVAKSLSDKLDGLIDDDVKEKLEVEGIKGTLELEGYRIDFRIKKLFYEEDKR